MSSKSARKAKGLRNKKAAPKSGTGSSKKGLRPLFRRREQLGRPQAQSTQVIARSARLPCSLRLTPPPAFLPRSGRQAPSPPLAALPGGGGRGNPFCERPSASPRMSLTRITVGGVPPPTPPLACRKGLFDNQKPPRRAARLDTAKRVLRALITSYSSWRGRRRSGAPRPRGWSHGSWCCRSARRCGLRSCCWQWWLCRGACR